LPLGAVSALCFVNPCANFHLVLVDRCDWEHSGLKRISGPGGYDGTYAGEHFVGKRGGDIRKKV